MTEPGGRREVSWWRAARGPGWMRVPRGVLAQHQPLGAAPALQGERTEPLRAGGRGSVQPQVRVGGGVLVSHVAEGVLHGGQVAARRDAHGLDDLLSAGAGGGEGGTSSQQEQTSRNTGLEDTAQR